VAGFPTISFQRRIVDDHIHANAIARQGQKQLQYGTETHVVTPSAQSLLSPLACHYRPADDTCSSAYVFPRQ
jgi:hypothetical protein